MFLSGVRCMPPTSAGAFSGSAFRLRHAGALQDVPGLQTRGLPNFTELKAGQKFNCARKHYTHTYIYRERYTYIYIYI